MILHLSVTLRYSPVSFSYPTGMGYRDLLRFETATQKALQGIRKSWDSERQSVYFGVDFEWCSSVPRRRVTTYVTGSLLGVSLF